MVRRKAYYFYEQRRRIRADLDWLAGQEMPRILWGRISRDEEVIRRFAYLAWEERQKTRALEDWLNAQRFLADIYVIEV
ncbi:MAG: DUF2934 domain-containing protein [Candidatus Parcubacteria bacterium]|nr:DUF2934 domain-containing protein [Candidatus Parcubacteria bacterium]